MSAADLVESFDLNRLPDAFYDNPFPYYRALRESDGDRLSENELLHNCIFMLNAGHHQPHRQRERGPIFRTGTLMILYQLTRPRSPVLARS